MRESRLDSRLRGNDMKDIYHLVPKSKISESGDYNLTGDRYRERIIHVHKDWPMVRIEEIIDDVKYTNKIQKSEFLQKGRYPIIDQSENFIAGYWDKEEDVFRISKPIVIFGDHTRNFKYIDFDFVLGADGVKILQPNENVNSRFLYYILQNLEIKNLGYSRHFKELRNKKIPLPPLSVQQEIVAEIEGYQKIIDGAKQIVENYKPKIKIDESWEMVELGKVCGFMTGGTPTSSVKEYYENGTIPWLVSGDIHKGKIFNCEGRITKKGVENSNTKFLPDDSVLIALNGQGKTRGTVALLKMEKATCNQSLVSINPKDKNTLLSGFVYYQLKSMYQEIRKITGDNQRSGLNIPIIKTIKIPLPPLKIQKQIVAQIEEEQKLVEVNKKLIEIFEGKIKAKIADVWG